MHVTLSLVNRVSNQISIWTKCQLQRVNIAAAAREAVGLAQPVIVFGARHVLLPAIS